MTKRLIVVPVAVAALAFPASALAHGGSHGKSASSPAAQCRAERAQDAQAFKDKYGTNSNKSNAFGQCVSQQARAMLGRMAPSPPLDDSGVDVVHAPRDVLGDLYHELLGAPWSLTLLVIAAALLALNV